MKYIVMFCFERMCYGGPEEGGWWYIQADPVSPDEAEMFDYTKGFNVEKEAYDYVRKLNSEVTPELNARYEHDFSSVLGGERVCAWCFDIDEDGWPSMFYDYPGQKERPHYE